MVVTAAREIDLSAEANAAGRTSAVSHLPKLKPDELAFLLGLLASPAGKAPPAFPAKADAALLWEYFERHGVGGVLGFYADRIPNLPPALAEAARHRYWSNCLHSQQALQTCLAIVEAARRAGVTVFFVKGPALVDQGYGDGGLRGFSDLDLFTGSASEARRLAEACGARVLIDSEQQNAYQEIRDSGRLVVEVNSRPVEIRFPVAGWDGPLFDLFPNGRLPELVWTAKGLPVPNAEWHFLFLLHHLMLHHFFGRFIWLLDLAVLARRERANLNWEKIIAESERLALREGLVAAANFCRQHLDPEFPEIPPLAHPAWNRQFIRHLVEPQVIATAEKNKQHVSAVRRGWVVLHGLASYFLMADVPRTGRPWNGPGGRWTIARGRCVLARRWRGRLGSWLAGCLSTLAGGLIYALARSLAWVSVRQKPQ